VSEFLLITPAGFAEVARKMCLDHRGHSPSGLVSWFATHVDFLATDYANFKEAKQGTPHLLN